MKPEEKSEELKKYYYSIRDCKNCSLSASRIKFVFGSGNANSRIMFIGEAPGRNEDLQGEPFVGQAGKILDELLGTIGYQRKDVFIANVLKCRPPQNRDPRQDEINLCRDYLFEQIKIIDPVIICTLGKYSTRLILETDEGITGLRGRVFIKDCRYILPINHPASVLYSPSRLEILKNDFARIKEVVSVIKTGIPNPMIKFETAGLTNTADEHYAQANALADGAEIACGKNGDFETGAAGNIKQPVDAGIQQQDFVDKTTSGDIKDTVGEPGINSKISGMDSEEKMPVRESNSKIKEPDGSCPRDRSPEANVQTEQMGLF
jgi:DNA polymerase